MTDFLLTIPAKLYDKARRIAEIEAQSVEDVLRNRLEESLDDDWSPYPEDEQAEYRALAYLSDDALWTIAREQMAAAKQARMQPLMDRNNFGTISLEEYQELEQLVEQGQRLMLRKAEAMNQLLKRGYIVSQDDLKPTNE